MEYADFYDLSVYANENWKGSFTEREVACNAYDYLSEMRSSQKKGEMTGVIKTLISNLEEDIANVSDEAEVWLTRIKKDLTTVVVSE